MPTPNSQRRPFAQTLPKGQMRITGRRPLREAMVKRNITGHPQASSLWPRESWGRTKPHLEPTGKPRARQSRAQANYFRIPPASSHTVFSIGAPKNSKSGR